MIELRQVSIEAGDFLLRDLSFQIELGAYVVLMGATGSGKTTILEAICGLRPVTAGQLLVHGTDVTDWPPRDRQIGYVPQDLALFPTLTVGEHLEFAPKIHRVDRREIVERVRQLAEILGISHLLERKVAKLSGGEAQRVALGRALALQPALLLLDEPLSALDEGTRGVMHELLRRVQRETGVTTLHVTHSREEAEALAERRLVLRGGAIVEEASPGSSP